MWTGLQRARSELNTSNSRHPLLPLTNKCHSSTSALPVSKRRRRPPVSDPTALLLYTTALWESWNRKGVRTHARTHAHTGLKPPHVAAAAAAAVVSLCFTMTLLTIFQKKTNKSCIIFKTDGNNCNSVIKMSHGFTDCDKKLAQNKHKQQRQQDVAFV